MKKLIFTYIIIVYSFIGVAQLSNNGATLSIQQNALVSSPMDLANNGKIYNKGHIYLAADWLNSSFYDTTGTLVLNGQNIQNIKHNNQDFKILIVDGPGEKILNSNANIISELSLKNGILTVNVGNNLVLKQNAVSTNSSQNSYVNGLLFNQGTGYKFFPIGKNSHYSPVELINVQNYSVVGLEMFAPNFNTSAGSGLTVSDDRYYELSYLEGNNANSQISLLYDNKFFASDSANLVIVQANDNEPFLSIGKNISGGKNINGITSKDAATKKYYTLALLGQINANLFIPSALSANAPHSDDRVVKIYGDDFSENDFTFMVFNKWGNLVFSTNSLEFMKNTGWDGTNKNGKKEPNGMLSYIIKAKDMNGNKLEKTGTIMIVN